MLELNNLRPECQGSFAGAVAAKSLDANTEAWFGVDVVHRHLVGMLGGGHPHRLKLGSDVR